MHCTTAVDTSNTIRTQTGVFASVYNYFLRACFCVSKNKAVMTPMDDVNQLINQYFNSR